MKLTLEIFHFKLCNELQVKGSWALQLKVKQGKMQCENSLGCKIQLAFFGQKNETKIKLESLRKEEQITPIATIFFE